MTDSFLESLVHGKEIDVDWARDRVMRLKEDLRRQQEEERQARLEGRSSGDLVAIRHDHQLDDVLQKHFPRADHIHNSVLRKACLVYLEDMDYTRENTMLLRSVCI